MEVGGEMGVSNTGKKRREERERGKNGDYSERRNF